MVDLIGRVLAIATGIALVRAILGAASWWVVLVLAAVTLGWTLGHVIVVENYKKSAT